MDDTPLPDPTAVRSFADDNGTTYVFTDIDVFDDFVSSERDFWQRFANSPFVGDYKEDLLRWIEDGLNRLQTTTTLIESTNDQPNDHTAWPGVLNGYNEGIWPTRTSHLGRRARALLNDQMTGDLRNRFIEEIRVAVRTGLMEVRLYDRTLQSIRAADLLSKNITAAVAQMQNLKNMENTAADLVSQHADLDSFVVEFGTRIDALFKKFEKEATEKAQQAAETVITDGILKEPAKHWSNKRFWHGLTKWGALSVFTVITIKAIYVIPSVATERLKGIPGIDQEPWVIAFFQLGAPVLLFLWLVRQLLKVFGHEQALESDAADRTTKTKTYLSLINEGKVTDEDRKLMLASLFRESSAQAKTEPAPGWFGTVVDRFTRPPNG